MNRLISFGLLVSSALMLQSCDSLRHTFGLDHYQPDASSVPINPPLTLPPDFSIKPPTPGAAPTNASTSTNKAKTALGQKDAITAPKSVTEDALLSKTKGQADPDIRKKIETDAEKENNLGEKIKAKIDEAKSNLSNTGGDGNDKSNN
jgi:hypothetical protein